MSNDRTFRIARLSDKQLVELWEKINEAFQAQNSQIIFGSSISYSLNELPKEKIERNSHAISAASIQADNPKYLVEFRRGISAENFSVRTPSSIADEVKIRVNFDTRGIGNTATLEHYLKLIKLIEEYTKPLSLDSSDTEESNISILNAELQKLTELATELTVGADAKRRELDSRRDELDQEYLAKQGELEVRYEAKKAELSSQKAALEKLQAELDDREHKHVRRELRETITTSIQDSITKPTRKNSSGNAYNWVAIYLAIGGAVAFGYFAYATQQTISTVALEIVLDSETGSEVSRKPAEGVQTYLLYVKLFLSSATALALLLYVVNWMRSIARDELEYRRKLQQYIFDMNRASWTIETILELSNSDLPEIPLTWLERVTNGLFETGDRKNSEADSLQALAALLNITTEAEIGPDGPKFRLNRKGVKKAAAEG